MYMVRVPVLLALWILVSRIIARSDGKMGSGSPGYSLTGDIGRVLGLIGAAWPETAEVNARQK